MEIPRISPVERIGDYLEKHPELAANTTQEPIKLKDFPVMRKKIVSQVKNSVEKYLKAGPTILPENEKRNNIPLLDIIIDGEIPLRLKIEKRYRHTVDGEPGHAGDGKFRFSGLSFTLHTTDEKTEVARFALVDYGNEFRLKHREVHPSYRRNGIAEAGLEAVEEFIKGYAQRVPDREPVIDINTAQLDVIRWLSKNGFETTNNPVTPHLGDGPVKVHDLDTVLTSLEKDDGKYDMGPHLYVFPGDFKGVRISPDWPGTGVNFDEAARIHLQKRLEVPKMNLLERKFPKLSAIISQTRIKLY